MSSTIAGLKDAWWMFYATFWALVFGFTVSGIVQAFVPRALIAKNLGDHKFKTVSKAIGLGAISSSCSYAASALAHSLYKKGADFTASMIFMFASTNLVLDLGLVMWKLMGWQFAVAEVIGGIVMCLLLWTLLPKLFPLQRVVHLELLNNSDQPQEIKSPSTWRDAAGFTIGDFKMMRAELVAGFLIAGLVGRLVPVRVWSDLFLHGHSFFAQLEGSILGPIIACLTFVCSVGNVPLAAALWHNGISFSGTIAFIYADLITFPLLVIYKKYYGLNVAFKSALVYWVTMSASGLIVGEIFTTVKAVPTRELIAMSSETFKWDATAILNLIALALVLGIYLLHRSKSSENSEFAVDPVCGMQVRKSDAPASELIDGVMYYFCMDGCRTDYLQRLAKEGR